MYMCQDQCEQIRKQWKTPSVGTIEREYMPVGRRVFCAKCSTTFYPYVMFTDRRCPCCHAMIRARPHSKHNRQRYERDRLRQVTVLAAV